MKVALISPEISISCLGLRYLAAALKQAGHQVRTLFLPRAFDDFEGPAERDEIAAWLRRIDPGLVGFSLMTNHLRRVTALMPVVRAATPAPVLWGGVHPTTDPEGSLAQADLVCLGEGEQAAVELAEALAAGRDPATIESLWLRTPGGIRRNRVRDRLADLDRLPYPDIDESDQALLHQGRVMPMTFENYGDYIFARTRSHFSIATRGCPFQCTYCCNSALRRVAGGPYVRTRSVANLIGELTEVRTRMPWVANFALWDDSFLSNSDEWIEEFCRRYAAEIGLPFFCNLQPSEVTERKIELLAQAGLIGVQMGLQTGSERTAREIYRRHATPEEFVRADRILDRHRGRILDRHYHVIVDNPYESDDDVAASALTLARVRRPFALTVFSLTFYPGTELYDRAVADGVLDPAANPAFEREYYTHGRSYLALVTRATAHTPPALTRAFVAGRRSTLVRALFYLYYYGWYRLRFVLAKRLKAAWIMARIERLERGQDARAVTYLRAIAPRIQ